MGQLPACPRTFLATLLVAAAMLMSPSPAGASKLRMPDQPVLSQSYSWHDGTRSLTVWMNPRLVSEFGPKEASASAMKQIEPGSSTVVHAQAGARIWRLPEGKSAETTLSQIRIIQPSSRYSPVFHDGPSENATMRALPGNVIVYFNPSWNAGRIQEWARGRGLTLLTELAVGPNVYVVQTDAGLVALETANAIWESGEVKAAFPDWWQPLQPR